MIQRLSDISVIQGHVPPATVHNPPSELLSMLESVADVNGISAVIAMNHLGEIIVWSETAERMLGWQKSEVLRKKLDEVIVPEKFGKLYRAVLQLMDPANPRISQSKKIRLRAIHKSGTGLEVECVVKLIRIGNESVLVGAIRDLTEDINREVELKNLLQQKCDLLNLQRDFITMTSHQFKTPLSNIYSSAELAVTYDEQLTHEQRVELLENIQVNAARLNRLLDEVQELNKLTNKIYQPQFARLSLRQVAEEAVAKVKQELNDYDREVELLSPDDIWISSDRWLLLLVVKELVRNAVKFGAGSPVKLRVSRHVDLWTEIEVVNGGPNISSEMLSHVFEPFYRGANTEQVAGEGLGLAKVRSGLELLNGTSANSITANSDLEMGTSFIVRLHDRRIE